MVALSDRTVCGIDFLLVNLRKAFINASSVKLGTTSRCTARVAAQVNRQMYAFFSLPVESRMYSAPINRCLILRTAGYRQLSSWATVAVLKLCKVVHTPGHITHFQVTAFSACRIAGILLSHQCYVGIWTGVLDVLCERDRHVMSVEVVGLGVVTNWDVVYSSLASYEIFIINEQSQLLHYGQTVQT